ncbi:MAG: RNA polymerase subunit sigma-24, partial [Nocardiaceae bacterium]|nr:RNA polymerase subunit sigma-24 [Nocardiaceae bacterium]
MATGPDAALTIVDGLVADGRLAGYRLLPATRAELLVRAGRPTEARAEFEAAARLTGNARERKLLTDRAAALAADE